MDSPVFIAGFVMLMAFCYFAGKRLSRQVLTQPSLEAALLVWLGFFLSICYYQVNLEASQRRTLVHEESDGIAQVYRMMQTLPKDQRTQMRLLLISYLDAKLRQPGTREERANQAQEIIGLQSQLYSLSCEMTNRHTLSDAQGQSLGNALNAMISLHYRCAYATEEGLPSMVVVVLLVQCGAAALMLGLGSRHAVICLIWLTVVTCALMLVVDLDSANTGLLRLDRTNLRDLVNILHQQEQL